MPLEQKISVAMREDRWEEAVTDAEELARAAKAGSGRETLRGREGVLAVTTYRLVAAMGKEERAEFVSAGDLFGQAQYLESQRKYVDGPAALREGAGDPPTAP